MIKQLLHSSIQSNLIFTRFQIIDFVVPEVKMSFKIKIN